MFFTEFEHVIEGSRSYTMSDAANRWEMEGGALTTQAWIKTIANTLRRSSTFAALDRPRDGRNLPPAANVWGVAGLALLRRIA